MENDFSRAFDTLPGLMWTAVRVPRFVILGMCASSDRLSEIKETG
jgi:hypothetical protein